MTALGIPREGGAVDVAAWTLPRSGNSLGAEAGLWLFSEGPEATRRLAAVPAYLPTGDDCRHSIEFIDSGQVSLSSVIRAECGARLLTGTATGALVLVDPTAESAERMSFRFADPAPGEELRFEPESGDTDGDGYEDLTLRVRLRAPSGAEESLSFRWVGRPSGLSRISATPSEELLDRVGRLSLGAVRKKERDQALQGIDALRRLLFSACAEGKTEKLTDGSGLGLACGSLAQVAEGLTGAAIAAYLARQTPWKALGELERSSFAFGPPRERTKAEWVKKITQNLETTPARLSERAPLPLGLDLPYPIASPLRFSPTGELLSLSAGGGVVAPFSPPAPPRPQPPLALEPGAAAERSPQEPAETPEPELPQRPRPWPLRPSGPAGEMLSAALPSCDRSEVQLAFSGPPGTVIQPRPLAFLAPRPGGCRSLLGKPLPAEIVGWEGGRLLALVAGEPVVSAGHLEPPEQPLAWGTSLGIAIWERAGLRLLTGPETVGVHHCVSAPGARKVACVRDNDVVVLEAAPSDG